MRVLYAVVLLMLSLMASVVLPAPKAVVAERPSPDFVAAALKDQETACGASLEVKYARDWSRVGRPGTHDIDENRYVRTSEVLRLDRTRQSGGLWQYSYDRGTGEMLALITSADGKRIGTIDSVLRYPFDVQDFLETALYPLYPLAESEQMLSQLVRRGVVSQDMVTIDGHDCWRIDIPTPEAMNSRLEKQVVFVDSAVGFCPRRIEFPWKHKPATVVSFEDYRRFGEGVWFPMRQTIRASHADGETVLVNSVSDISTGRSIPKDELLLKFPSGTKVTVRDLDAQFTVP